MSGVRSYAAQGPGPRPPPPSCARPAWRYRRAGLRRVAGRDRARRLPRPLRRRARLLRRLPASTPTSSAPGAQTCCVESRTGLEPSHRATGAAPRRPRHRQRPVAGQARDRAGRARRRRPRSSASASSASSSRPASTASTWEPTSRPPTLLSDRALEPLYNIDVVLRAFARVRQQTPGVRLVIAGKGTERGSSAPPRS